MHCARISLLVGVMVVGGLACSETSPTDSGDQPRPEGKVRASARPAGFVTLKQHRARLEKKCRGGDGFACSTLSMQHRATVVSRRYLLLARDYQENACLGGMARACAPAALWWGLASVSGASADKARARHLLEVGCKARHGESCTNLSRLVAAGEGGPIDTARAARLAELGYQLDREACGATPADRKACKRLVRKHGGAGETTLAGMLAYHVFVKLRVLWARACDQADAESCLRLAVIYRLGRGGGTDATQAARYADLACAHHYGNFCEHRPSSLRQACKRGDPERCAQLGLLFEKGARGPRSRRLEWGDPIHVGLARLPGAGYPVPRDPKKAQQLYATGCAADIALGCTGLARFIGRGEGGRKDLARARALHSKACKLGAEESCNELPEILDRRCKAGGFESCFERAIKHLDARTAEDDLRGRELIEKACQGNVAASCNLLGVVYENGTRGVKADLVRARKYYAGACAIVKGIRMGCTDYGRVQLEGLGGGKDLVGARRSFTIACDVDDKSCYELGLMWDRGQGGERDRDEARFFLNTACKAGRTKACTALRALE